MNPSEIEDFLEHGLDLMGIDLDGPPENLSRLAVYFQELRKWNSKVNLVARTLSDKDILEDHFLDSLTLLLLLPAEGHGREKLLDVGTGAGFPGLVLKTACPGIAVTLIEPRRSRFYFLKHMIRTLQLRKVTVINDRLEDKDALSRLATGPFSFITSRAFTDISRFVRMAEPYLDSLGRIVLMKGPGAAEELLDPALQAVLGNYLLDETKKLHLPYSGKERCLVTMRRKD